MAEGMPLRSFRIGSFDVLPDRHELSANGQILRLEPKVMSVLCTLADAGNDVVPREAFLDRVWRDDDAADERLTRAISQLRKQIRDVDPEPYILTVPKRGYRLVPIVTRHPREADDPQNVPIKNQPLTEPIPHAWPSPVNSVPKPAPTTIAVLPFDDLDPTSADDHFAIGMTEEILNLLTKASNLRVAGRESSFAYSGKAGDVREIARSLNVAYLLQGSIRRDGDNVRVAVNLIHADDGFQIWANHYDGLLSHIFDVQDQIALSIVSELAGAMNVDFDWAVPGRSTSNQEAYSLFLQGRQLTHQLNGQTTIPMGIDLLNRAVSLDPQFAEAWSWLALAHHILPEFSATRTWSTHARLSRQASDRALAIDPTSSIGLLARALARTNDLKFAEAVPIYEKALSVDPHNVETMGGYGLMMMALGLPHVAEPYFEKIIEKDPLCGIYHTAYGGVLRINGKFEASEFYFRKSFELGFGPAAMGVVLAMSQRGEHARAKEFLMENFHALGPMERDELKSPLIRTVALKAFLERQPVAKWMVGKVLAARIGDIATQSTTPAVIRLLFMDRPDLFMRHVLQKPNPYVGFSVARVWEPTPESENLRAHPDFPEFARKIGMVDAWNECGWPSLIQDRTKFLA